MKKALTCPECGCRVEDHNAVNRLIAAAPVLLQTCRKLLDVLEAASGPLVLLYQAEIAEAKTVITERSES